MAEQGLPGPDDPYARSDYRRLIAWRSRSEREGPFLTQLLERAPDRSVLDVGCGSGEHIAFFARSGARAVGLDRSETMLEQAREHEERGEGRFVLGDAIRAASVLSAEPPFGMAICLGNTVPHILEEDELRSVVESLCELLLPGGLFLLQILNYRRLIGQDIRHLPVNVRSEDGAKEVVFLRLLKNESRERILFFPTTLVLDPTSDEPVSVARSRRVELRPWVAADLRPIFESRGFRVSEYGDMQGGPYDETESHDLVLVASRERS